MNCDHLPPIMKWPGGKARVAQKLIKRFPDHNTYVEPFAGGASVFFAKPLAQKNVLGDKDSWPIDLYRQVKAGKLRMCRGGIKHSRGLYERAKKSKQACYKLALSTLSWHGDRSTYGGDRSKGKLVGAGKLRKLPCYEMKLRKAKLRVASFESTMRAHDSRSTLHFLDPPWPLESKYSENFYAGGKNARVKSNRTVNVGKAFDPEYVARVSDKMKGHVFVIYGDHPSVRKAFLRRRGWKTKGYRVATNKGTGGIAYRVNWVAYKPARGSGAKLRRR